MVELDENQLKNGPKDRTNANRPTVHGASLEMEKVNASCVDPLDHVKRKRAKELVAKIRMKVSAMKPSLNSTSAETDDNSSSTKSCIAYNTVGEELASASLDAKRSTLFNLHFSEMGIDVNKGDNLAGARQDGSLASNETKSVHEQLSPMNGTNVGISTTTAAIDEPRKSASLDQTTSNSTPNLAGATSLIFLENDSDRQALKDFEDKAEENTSYVVVEQPVSSSLDADGDSDEALTPDLTTLTLVSPNQSSPGSVPDSILPILSKSAASVDDYIRSLMKYPVIGDISNILGDSNKNVAVLTDENVSDETIHPNLRALDPSINSANVCTDAKITEVKNTDNSGVPSQSLPLRNEHPKKNFSGFRQKAKEAAEYIDRYCPPPILHASHKGRVSRASGSFKKSKDHEATVMKSGDKKAILAMYSGMDKPEKMLFNNNLPLPYVHDISDASTSDLNPSSTSQTLADITNLVELAANIPEDLFLESFGSSNVTELADGQNILPKQYRRTFFNWKKVDDGNTDPSRSRLRPRMLSSLKSSKKRLNSCLSSGSFKYAADLDMMAHVDGDSVASIPWFKNIPGPVTSMCEKPSTLPAASAEIGEADSHSGKPSSILAAAATEISGDECHSGEISEPKVLWTRGNWMSPNWQMVVASIITPKLFGPVCAIYPLDTNFAIVKSRHQCIALRSCEIEMVEKTESVMAELLSVSDGPLQEIFCFTLKTAKGKFRFAAKTAAERKEWMESLRDAGRPRSRAQSWATLEY